VWGGFWEGFWGFWGWGSGAEAESGIDWGKIHGDKNGNQSIEPGSCNGGGESYFKKKDDGGNEKEHRKKTPSKWDKHSKPRSGDPERGDDYRRWDFWGKGKRRK